METIQPKSTRFSRGNCNTSFLGTTVQKGESRHLPAFPILKYAEWKKVLAPPEGFSLAKKGVMLGKDKKIIFSKEYEDSVNT